MCFLCSSVVSQFIIIDKVNEGNSGHSLVKSL